MKINVLVEQSGSIVPTHCTFAPLLSSLPVDDSTTHFAVSSGHSVCEVELPSELHEHLAQGTLAQAIGKYRIEQCADVARLVSANDCASGK